MIKLKSLLNEQPKQPKISAGPAGRVSMLKNFNAQLLPDVKNTSVEFETDDQGNFANTILLTTPDGRNFYIKNVKISNTANSANPDLTKRANIKTFDDSSKTITLDNGVVLVPGPSTYKISAEPGQVIKIGE